MSARTLAPSSHRDDLAVLRDYTVELDAALAAGDRARAATALATLSQTVHLISLAVDPDRLACAALTHRDGRYVCRPAAAVDADPVAGTLPSPSPSPSPYCWRHQPFGTADVCGACGAARRRYRRWSELRRNVISHLDVDVQSDRHAGREQEDAGLVAAVENPASGRAGDGGLGELLLNHAEVEDSDLRVGVLDGLGADRERRLDHLNSSSVDSGAATPGSDTTVEAGRDAARVDSSARRVAGVEQSLDDPRTLAAWCIERQRQQGERGYEALHRAVVGAGCAAASSLHHGRDEDARRWAHAHDLLSTRSTRVLLTRPRREVPVTDPAHTVLPVDAAPPTMVAVPEQAAEVRGVCHPAVAGAVDAAALRADSDPDGVVCSCTPLVGDRHARGCDRYDGWAE